MLDRQCSEFDLQKYPYSIMSNGSILETRGMQLFLSSLDANVLAATASPARWAVKNVLSVQVRVDEPTEYYVLSQYPSPFSASLFPRFIDAGKILRSIASRGCALRLRHCTCYSNTALLDVNLPRSQSQYPLFLHQRCSTKLPFVSSLVLRHKETIVFTLMEA